MLQTFLYESLGEVDGGFPFSLGRDRNEVKRNVEGMSKTCARCVHMARMISRRQGSLPAVCSSIRAAPMQAVKASDLNRRLAG
jgi:hypothetical protein